MCRVYRFALLVTILCPLPAAFGWGAHGHRTITLLALDGLGPSAPAWLGHADIRARVAFQANAVDRWRGWRADVLAHENNPDHYLDVDVLEEFGLTLETIPKLRREYLRVLIIAKHLHPENVSPYDASKDRARANEWPGFALHAIAEHYAKLQSEFNTLQILEKLDDPARAAQLEQTRANVIYHMGLLSHFVADLAQPLHTTIHHHGWVGENPHGYTTDRRFHRRIDTGVLVHHRLTYASLKGHVSYDLAVNATDPWDDVLAYFRRSHEALEPLYQLERDGALDREAGREFITLRLTDAAAMLSALYRSAWQSAKPTQQQIENWVRYNQFDSERRLQGALAPGAGPAAASAPTGSSNPD